MDPYPVPDGERSLGAVFKGPPGPLVLGVFGQRFHDRLQSGLPVREDELYPCHG